MRFGVLLTEDAASDLESIHESIAVHDGPAKAAHVLDRIADVFESLAELPDRGTWPGELLALGIREYGEVFFNPYRVVYRVAARRVHVYLIADGRRDPQGVLARRMLRS